LASVEPDGDDDLEPGAGRHPQVDAPCSGPFADDMIGEGQLAAHHQGASMPGDLQYNADFSLQRRARENLLCPDSAAASWQRITVLEVRGDILPNGFFQKVARFVAGLPAHDAPREGWRVPDESSVILFDADGSSNHGAAQRLSHEAHLRCLSGLYSGEVNRTTRTARSEQGPGGVRKQISPSRSLT